VPAFAFLDRALLRQNHSGNWPTYLSFKNDWLGLLGEQLLFDLRPTMFPRFYEGGLYACTVNDRLEAK